MPWFQDKTQTADASGKPAGTRLVIEAVEFTLDLPDSTEFTIRCQEDPVRYACYDPQSDTWLPCEIGDMIRVDFLPSHVYPINRATFEATYEPVPVDERFAAARALSHVRTDTTRAYLESVATESPADANPASTAQAAVWKAVQDGTGRGRFSLWGTRECLGGTYTHVAGDLSAADAAFVVAARTAACAVNPSEPKAAVAGLLDLVAAVEAGIEYLRVYEQETPEYEGDAAGRALGDTLRAALAKVRATLPHPAERTPDAS